MPPDGTQQNTMEHNWRCLAAAGVLLENCLVAGLVLVWRLSGAASVLLGCRLLLCRLLGVW
eukprot:11152093-Lingulodinium_polyedra.AAC.1